MVEGTTLGNKNPEDIRQEIEGTRASLDEKIHSLESNVQDAVQAAKEKLSPMHYVESNPWACFGAAVGVGFLLGQLTTGSSSSYNRDFSTTSLRGFRPETLGSFGASKSNGNGNSGASAAPGAAAGAFSGLASTGMVMAASKFFDKEIRDLRNYAIGQAMGVVKELAKGAVSPELSPRIGEVLDRATRALGATPAPANSTGTAHTTNTGNTNPATA